MTATILPERLEAIAAIPLARGGHDSLDDGICVMEAVVLGAAVKRGLKL